MLDAPGSLEHAGDLPPWTLRIGGRLLDNLQQAGTLQPPHQDACSIMSHLDS